MVRALIIDSQPLYAERLIQIIDKLGPRAQASHFDRLEPALAAARRDKKLDLIVLDLQIPGIDGFATISQLHNSRSDLPIIAVSTSENSAAIRHAIASGARGYIPRSLGAELVSSAIQLVLSGGVYLPFSVLSDAEPGTDLAEQAPPYLHRSLADCGPECVRIEQLTPRQRQVLVKLAQGQSNQDIADALTISVATVKLHVNAVLRGLRAKNRTRAAAIAMQAGIVPWAAQSAAE